MFSPSSRGRLTDRDLDRFSGLAQRKPAWAVAMAAWRSSISASKRLAAWTLVITRQWPELSGLMSMKTRVLSSSKIFIEGTWPSRILQKTQSMGGL